MAAIGGGHRWPEQFPRIGVPCCAMPDITFRRLRHGDLPLLAGWLQQPHVARWFHPADDWLDEMLEELGSEWLEHWIAELDGVPLGFIQRYDAALAPSGPWSAQAPGTWGLDLFVGDADMLGRGHGVAMLQAFIDQVCWPDERVQRLLVDPEDGNEAAFATYRRAGFAPTDDDPDIWMLERA
jgi:aminoglycoside 6'-N-acetyltransferase